MKQIFKAHNYYQAFSFFYNVPFYSFRDFLFKKNLEFEENEVFSIEKISTQNQGYKINYNSKKFNGWFLFYGKLEETHKLIEFKKENTLFDPKSIIGLMKTFFSIYNPILWYIASIQLIIYFYYNYRDVIFPGNSKPELYVNNFCSVKCVKSISLWLSVSLIPVGVCLLGFFIGLTFFFYFSKKIKNAQEYNYVKLTSFMLLIITCSMSATFFENKAHGNNMDKIVVIYRLLNNPEYFKNTNNRKIASEIIGKEIKEIKPK